MALLEDTLTGWGGGALIGLGAILVAPVVLPIAESIVRPVVKTVIWGGLAIVDGVSEVISEGYDQVSGLVAEARAEFGSGAPSSRSAPVHR